MSDPITFESTSPRFLLPLLFAGQAQKEVFVNEALSLLDGLIHCAIEGAAASPPASPADGSAWLVAASPSGDWAGQAANLALRQGGEWLFVVPREGMRVLNKATGQDIRYIGASWSAPAAPADASGGAVIDTKARETLANLIAALREAGVLSA